MRGHGLGGGSTPVATVTITVGAQDGENVPVTYTTDINTTCEAVLYLSTETKPVAADFDGGGAPTYIDSGPVSLTTTGVDIPINIPDDLNGSYKLAFLPSGGGDVDVAESNSVVLDTRTVTTPWTPTAETALRYQFDFTDPTMFDVNGADTKFAMTPQGNLAGMPSVIESASKGSGAIASLAGLRGYQRTADGAFSNNSFPAQAAGPCTLAWLHAPDSSAAVNSMVIAGHGSGGGATRFYGLASGVSIGGSSNVGQTSVIADQPIICVATVTFDDPNYTVRYYENGVLVGTDTGVTFNGIPDSIAFGHYPISSSNSSYRGYIFDVCEFNVLDDAIRQKVEGYWADMASISLPSGHPYENTVPTV